MDVQICEIYDSSYLNIISALFQDLDLPQLIDRLVPVDPQ
ncbi:transposase, partial [Anoxybacillus geothermalis]|nr:transposase [Anoxybacillus geothermalis]